MALATLALSAVWYGSRYTSGIIDVPFMIAFYELGATGDRRRQLGIGGVATAVLLVGTLVGDEGWGGAFYAIGWMSAAVLLGELVRSRRLLLVEHAARAERAEAERDAEAERRVAEERIRIARDVHDVLAHTVSLMTVQAGVAADAVERDPLEAKAALNAIRAAGREAMGEVRALVSVLRGGSGPVGTAPAPGLYGLDEVVAAARASGVAVELSVDVAGAPLPAIVELTAFRLVQEGLTNIVRHAQAARAEIEVRRDDAELIVRIRDDGRGRPAPHPMPPGFGLRGMRERVESLGGTLTFGPGPDGGWVVAAVVPAGSG